MFVSRPLVERLSRANSLYLSVPTGLLSSKDDVDLQISVVLRELIDRHISGESFLTIESQEMEDKATHNAEFKAIQMTCTTCYNMLSASTQIPNEHFLSLVAFLFLKLGKLILWILQISGSLRNLSCSCLLLAIFPSLSAKCTFGRNSMHS